MSTTFKVEARLRDRGDNKYEVVTKVLTTDLQSAVIVRDALDKHLPGLLAVSQGAFSVEKEVVVSLSPAVPSDLGLPAVAKAG